MPVSLAAAPRRELPKGTITMEPQAAGSQWGPKELKMVLTQFKNGFHLHLNADPQIARESTIGACQSDMPS